LKKIPSKKIQIIKKNSLYDLDNLQIPINNINIHQNLESEINNKNSFKKTSKCANKGCNKTFYKLKNFIKHFNSCQFSNKAFKCNYSGCSKSFSQIGNLNKHKLIHYERKIYKCEFCESIYTCYKKFKVKSIFNIFLYSIKYLFFRV